jgi:hypothetical protein
MIDDVNSITVIASVWELNCHTVHDHVKAIGIMATVWENLFPTDKGTASQLLLKQFTSMYSGILESPQT